MAGNGPTIRTCRRAATMAASSFVFGATLPTVVCAPLYVCDLVLQAGEAVNDLNIGDSVRWQITPATQGTGEAPSPM